MDLRGLRVNAHVYCVDAGDKLGSQFTLSTSAGQKSFDLGAPLSSIQSTSLGSDELTIYAKENGAKAVKYSVHFTVDAKGVFSNEVTIRQL